jgi:ligand-binding sensor domain-containing protein/signal transduction histidine kinase
LKPYEEKLSPLSSLRKYNAQNNRKTALENLPVFTLDESSLPEIVVPLVSQGDTTHYIRNGTGQKVPTGIPIPANGKVVPAIRPRPINALPPAFKDASSMNISYLDVDQAMSSSYIYSIIEDSNGHLWFGTQSSGVSRYDGESFLHFTEKEGLSNNYIISMIEDQSGNLWFGTWGGGLTLYNGENFIHFTENEGLTNNYIHSVFEDKAGNIWIGTEGGGVTLYKKPTSEKEGTFTHFTQKEGLSNNSVRSILEDKNGNIWLGTLGGGLNKFAPPEEGNPGVITHYSTKNGLTNDQVLAILEDQNGDLWLGTFRGITIYHPSLEGESASFTHLTENEGLASNNIRSLMEDRRGNIWLGTWTKGLTKYEPPGNGHEGYLSLFTEKEGLSNIDIWSMIEDEAGNLWIGTFGGGVNRFNGLSFVHFTENEGLSNSNVLSIEEDQSGNLWFGTLNGGLNFYDGSSFLHFTEENGLDYEEIRAMEADGSGNLWFGVWGLGVMKYEPARDRITYFSEQQGLNFNSVHYILEDKNGNIWFGTFGGGLSMFDGKTFTHLTEKEGLSNNYVTSMIEDQSGNLWFGTWGGGLNRYEPAEDGKEGVLTIITDKQGLIHNNVWSVQQDEAGDIWIGTEGGLSKYQPAKENQEATFTHFSTEEGLSNRIIYSIIEYEPGNYFVATERGLNSIQVRRDEVNETTKPEKFTVNSFNKQSGLKGLDFNPNSTFVDSKNRFWSGSGKSLTMLDLTNFQLSQKPPTVYLKELAINERVIDYRNYKKGKENEISFSGVQPFENYPLNLKLPYSQNHLTFYFAGVDRAAPHKIQYSHRMLGLSNIWSNPSMEAKADYRNLSHGTYTFQISAISENGDWSPPFSYTFTINPPWWSTLWAYGVYAILFLGGIRIFSLWRLRKLQSEKQQLQKRVEERTGELKNKSEELLRSLEHLKATQEQLIQQEKLASLGQLTAGIAHEIKNPLNFVNNFSEVSVELIVEAFEELEKMEDSAEKEEIIAILEDVKSNLSKVNEHGTRANGIVTSMLQHSRGGAGARELTDLNALIKEYVNLAYHSTLAGGQGMRVGETPINVDIDLQLDNNVGLVELVSEDFSRVIVNLCNNAFDAMREKSNGDSDDYIPKLSVRTKAVGNQVMIEVEDNGPGIPEDIKDKILQPFFTTKKGTEGTGLGLSITHDIIKAHGGTLQVNSSEMGSIFTIKIQKK